MSCSLVRALITKLVRVFFAAICEGLPVQNCAAPTGLWNSRNADVPALKRWANLQCAYGALAGRRWTVAGLSVVLAASVSVAAQPSAPATAGFESYVARVEAKLNAQHQSAENFLGAVDLARLRRGELIIGQITSGAGTELPGALLHDWRGAAFIPGGKAAEFERAMKDFGGYPRLYAPQVVSARVIAHDGDRFQVTMRVRQKHVLTVMMDTAYDVRFGRLDDRRGYSISRSTKISEIDAPGTSHERALGSGEEHGFLWRMNTYWSYEERDGGLYIEIESVSLSRSIPIGLGWAVGPFVESVPRDSLEFTLNATRNALTKRPY